MGALISGIQARIQVQYSYNTGNYGFPVFFSRLCTGLIRDYTGKYRLIQCNTVRKYESIQNPVFGISLYSGRLGARIDEFGFPHYPVLIL